MKILQVNTTDVEGGAAVIAWNLFKSYRERGHDSFFVVGQKTSNNKFVYEIPHSNSCGDSKLLISDGRGIWRVRSLLRKFYKMRSNTKRMLGWENFHYPNSRKVLELVPTDPDIIHLHNLHGRYFDLRFLPSLSKRRPTIITLHDMWMLTGHCAHSLNCDRWITGCGHCPDLSLYPSIDNDGTGFNWRRKRNIYRRSTMYIATPSQWLMDKVKASILQDVMVEARVIHNGVDTRIFHPADKSIARQKMGLLENAIVLFFVAAHHIKNHPFKDYSSLEIALNLVSQETKNNTPIVFMALGQSGETEKKGNLELRFLPYLRTREDLACLYQAADLYVHAAKADNFPNSILEALACGTPVVATGVGGIPEQIENGKSGFITKPADPADMAQAILHLLENDQLRMMMANYAAITVKEHFSLDRQVDQYLDWYQEILERDKSYVLPQDN